MSRAAAIAKVLHGKPMLDGYICRCPGLSHGKGKGDLNPSLFIKDGERQLLVRCFAGCDSREVLEPLRRRGLIGSRQHNIAPPLNRARRHGVSAEVATPYPAHEAARIRAALTLWPKAIDPAGTAVEAYLATRGLHAGEAANNAIRFHSALRYEGVIVPAMLALFRDIATDEPCGIHRTFLDYQGRKLGRRMLGRAKGAAIKLDSDTTVTTGIAVAEGVETALTIIGAGWRPVWALGSAGGIERFPVLHGIEAITIFSDHDEVGLKAARVCARRWADAGREARILLPPAIGTDWNDLGAA